MSSNIHAPYNTISNQDGQLLAYNNFNVASGSVYIGGLSHGDSTAAPHNTGGTTINHCPPVTALFKGRQGILQRLDAYFCPRAGGERHRREFLLYGMGGSGKSQIALKFAEVYEQRFKYVLWLDATNKATIEQGYKDIATALGGANDAAVSLDAAKASLAALREEWLLVVDGADDADAMSGLWPPGRSGNILYTSRNPTLKNFASNAVSEIAEMDDDEAVQLLLDAARLMPASDAVTALATGVVHKLGNLALAIDQAGAYIARGECRIYDFVETLERHRASLLGVDAYSRASSDKRAVYATWELSYSAIKRKAARKLWKDPLAHVARNALQLLSMLAYFHFEDVTEEIFRRAAEDPYRGRKYPLLVDFHRKLAGDRGFPKNILPLQNDKRWNSQPFRECTAMLASYSLLWLDKTLGVISMHRLVHQWAFDRLSRKPRLASLRSAAATLAGSIRWPDTIEEYAMGRQLIPHLLALFERASIDTDDPLCNSVQMENVASVLHENGLDAQAVSLRRRALALKMRLLGIRDEGTLASIGDLAISFSQIGRAAEAEVLHREALEVRKRIKGPEHPDTLKEMGHLALSLGKQGRAAEAEALHREELDIKKRVLGPEHPSTLRCMGNLATTLTHQGRAAEAESLHREDLDVKRRILGPEHPETLTSMGNLAVTFMELGRAADAELLHQEKLEVSRRILGPEHPNTLWSMSNLAVTYRGQGRASEAEAMYQEVIEIKKRIRGPEHPDTLRSMVNLAVTYADQGRAAEAAALHTEAVDVSMRVMGPEHPDTLYAMYSHAKAMRSLGKESEALALMRRCYELLRHKHGEDDPVTRSTLDIVNSWLVEASGGSSSTAR